MSLMKNLSSRKFPQATLTLLRMCLLFLSPGRLGLWFLRLVAVMHHVQRMSGNMKIMTQEAELWHLGTSPLWTEWDSRSLPTVNGRMVKSSLG